MMLQPFFSSEGRGQRAGMTEGEPSETVAKNENGGEAMRSLT